jgi:23S rRNA (uracil1939-C5)-methyltransferase
LADYSFASFVAYDSITVEIDRVDTSGDGVARAHGMRIHVPYTIPGELVRVRIERQRGRAAWAALDAVLEPSPHRIAPRCSHFGPPDTCGGCTWQHIAYAEQLRLKSQLVRDLMVDAMGTRAPDVLPTLPATPVDNPWGYRHKVHFVFGRDTRGELVMGHYTRGSRHVFDARECPVHDPRGNAFAFRLREQCAAAGVTAATLEKSRASSGALRNGTLRSVALRVGAATPELLATLVVTNATDKRLRSATLRALDGPDAPQSFHLNVHARPDPYIFGPETRHLRGPHHLRERVADTSFLISPTAFFQTNIHAAEILVRLTLDALHPGQPVLDLYAGVGLFAVALAKRGDRVIAVEENRAATEDGGASLRLNRIGADRCRFVARRVETALRAVQPRDAVHAVLDPPREGCDGAVIDELFGRLHPARVVYVSCNPEALARDLAKIASHGYRAQRLQPVDMFPHTAHVETVAVLDRLQSGNVSQRAL